MNKDIAKKRTLRKVKARRAKHKIALDFSSREPFGIVYGRIGNGELFEIGRTPVEPPKVKVRFWRVDDVLDSDIIE